MNLTAKGQEVLAEIFHSEMDLFLASRRIRPVTAVEDRRVGIIALIAAFAGEVLDGDARARRFLECERAWEENHDPDRWWRMAYLDAACALLSGEGSHLYSVTRRLAVGSSSIRSGLFAPVALAVHLIDPIPSGLPTAVTTLLDQRYMYDDAGLALFVGCRAERHEKLDLLGKWLHLDLGESSRNRIHRLLGGLPVGNELIFEEFFDLMASLTERCLNHVPRSRMAQRDGQFQVSLPFDMASRIARHPMFRASVSLSR